MSDSLRIELSRTRAIAVCVCLLAAGLVLFVSGTASGLLLASAAVKDNYAPAPLPVTAPAAEPAAIPAPRPNGSAPGQPSEAAAETATETGEPTSAPPIPANIPTLVAVPPETPPGAERQTPSSEAPNLPASGAAIAQATPLPAAGTAAHLTQQPTAATAAGSVPGATQPSETSTLAIPLFIKVCSFVGKTGAEEMVAALAAKGYHASLVHSVGAQDRTWYVVRLGPYTEWNSAAEVAARVAIAENVRPEIGPMR